ncbi:MAG: hypothetical protein AAF267_25395 [Deinococcota bacterium]
MAHPWHHAISSAKKFGGDPEDYLELHKWFDQTKAHLPDVRHRALLHHSFGIFLAEQMFGTTLTLANGRQVPIRPVAEQHILEDLGYIPTVQDWLKHTPLEPWMGRAKSLSQELEDEL